MDDKTIYAIESMIIIILVVIIIYLLLFVKKSSSTTLPTSTIFPSSTPIPLPTTSSSSTMTTTTTTTTTTISSSTTTTTTTSPSTLTFYNECPFQVLANVHLPSGAKIGSVLLLPYLTTSTNINYTSGMFINFVNAFTGQYLGTVYPSPGQVITVPSCS